MTISSIDNAGTNRIRCGKVCMKYLRYDSIPTIKFHLINFLWNHFAQTFDPSNTCTFSFLYPCNKCNKPPKF